MSRSPCRLLTISFTVLYVLSSLCTAGPDPSASEQEEPSEAFQFLRKAVENSKDQKGYHLDVRYEITSPDREDPGTIRSKGTFRKPGDFKLQSQTLSGMNVKSYGSADAIAHINPSTHRINTSEQLGITAVDRTLLDPFKHFDLLLKPDYNGFSCSFDGTEEINGTKHRVVSVTAGPAQIRDVMKKFKDQFDRPVKPEKTDATYRVFIDPDAKLIHKIKIDVRSQMKPEKEQKENSGQQEGEEDELSKKDLIDKTPDAEKNQADHEPVTMKVKGTFTLSQYNEGLDFDIPDDVRKKLEEWAKNGQ